MEVIEVIINSTQYDGIISAIDLVNTNQTTLIEHLINVQRGLHTIIMIGVFWFFSQVVKILYYLFGKIFFGGI